jgi:hypothetical protein
MLRLTLAGKRQMTNDDETELSPLKPTNANSDSTGKSKKIRYPVTQWKA